MDILIVSPEKPFGQCDFRGSPRSGLDTCTNLYTSWATLLGESLVEAGHSVSYISCTAIVRGVHTPAQKQFDVGICITYADVFRNVYSTVKAQCSALIKIAEYFERDRTYACDIQYQTVLRSATEIRPVSGSSGMFEVPLFRTLPCVGRDSPNTRKFDVLIDGPPNERHWQYIENNKDRLFHLFPEIYDQFEGLNCAELSSRALYGSSVEGLKAYPEATPDSFEEILFKPLGKLRADLIQSRNFVFTTSESFGGLILDALSCETVVHVAAPPLVPKKGSPVVVGSDGEYPPNVKLFGSWEELRQNVKTAVWEPLHLLEASVWAEHLIGELSRLKGFD